MVLLTHALLALPAGATDIGTRIDNTAQITYTNEGGAPITRSTNTVTLIVEPLRTSSTIEFFRFSPNAPDAIIRQINGSDYAPSGELTGPYETVGAPINGDTILDLSSDLALSPARSFSTGELMFARVIDAGQNGNPNRIETVNIDVTADSGDRVTLRLYESGPDTGEFFAYIPTTRASTAINDNMLTTGVQTQLQAQYVDAFDLNEISVDTALIDNQSRVFNALTGDLINDALVTLIDEGTGLPATVYGIDGISLYPSSVVTGQLTRDASGFAYDLEDGEFRFPVVFPGNYLLQIVTPDGFNFSSIYTPADFATLSNGPFEIEPNGSYGKGFGLAATGPLALDVPIDPQTDLVLSKTATPTTGDIGNFIRYNVTLENTGNVASTVTMSDIAPQGFRYVDGSSRLDEVSIGDPVTSPSGNGLTYSLPALASGQAYNLSYVMQIGASAGSGEQVNSAVIVDGSGQEISNIARATVTIVEELFRTTSTIIGRVTENSCDAEQEWARDISQGDGVAGVRLYMETGAYVVTDEDGLYHFEGVSEGTHVVQVDEATLPTGYEMMVCEENTQYAGLGRNKFIDVQGGGIWRANFYLMRTGEIEEVTTQRLASDITEYKNYDKEWLDTQNSAPSWVYPNATRTPSLPSVNIGIKHGPDHTVDLELNGHNVPLTNFQARDSNTDRDVLLSRWRGVDILDGKNVFIAKIKDKAGNVTETIRKEIHYIDTIARVTPVIDQSVLTADGRTAPVIAISVEDEAGRPVHAGRRLNVTIEAPYLLEVNDRLEREDSLVSPQSGRTQAVVGDDGIARIRLEPTLQTGTVSLSVTLDDGRQEDISMYLQAEKRDWIVVGLAEGSLGQAETGGRDLSDDDTNGRVAFFAKGLVKGDWLLTLAVDTDKRRGDRDDELFDFIDPNAYYTLYGDRTYQDHEAQSRYPFFIKLEKNQFFAMFGDYRTGLTDAELTRYNRDLSGFKTEYIGDNLEVIAFAAETNQGFAKDELPANGTSSGYRTSFSPIVVNSEKISVETRDRLRPDRVIDTVQMVRHLDYTIDNLSGEIIFRLPVDSSDALLNPKVIVIDYESVSDAERNLTYGARVTAKTKDERLRASVSYLNEEGRAERAGGEQEVIGADVEYQLTAGTQIRVEAAQSRDEDEVSSSTANAYLAEIIHTSEGLSAEAYIRQEDEGFGVGQQSGASNGIRRLGAQATYQLSENIDEETGRRKTRNITGQVYKEDSLSQDSSRTVAELLATQDSEVFGLSAGLRHVAEERGGETVSEGVMAVASARVSNPHHGFTVSASHEEPLNGDQASILFPRRTVIGVDKTITHNAIVSARHERLESSDVTSNNSYFGVSFQPWTGTDFSAQTDLQRTQDSARRIGATVGVDQQWQIDENWRASVGISQRRILSGEDSAEGADGSFSDEIVEDNVNSTFETNEDRTSLYAGIAYNSDVTSASARVEGLYTDDSDIYTGIVSVVRELSEMFSVAGSARTTYSDIESSDINALSSSTNRTDLRGAIAWRPRNEDTVVLNRLDLSYDKDIDGTTVSKLVNNFAANTMVTDRLQATWNYGLKFIDTEFDNVEFDSVTHLLGGELRFDVTERIDLGIHGSALITDNGNSAAFAYGPSIGISPIDNTWVSVGYNVDGYNDDDFSAAEYSNEGFFIKLRVKFDQDSLQGLLNAVSPTKVNSSIN